MESIPRLKAIHETAFAKVRIGVHADRIVFFLGRLCAEDFWEIVLLCANGYGIGALKILRGMYEKAVTARYIHAHPDESDAFLEFHWVSQHRLVEAIRKTFGDDLIPKGTVEECEENFLRARKRFEVTDCRKCGNTRINYTWSKLDFVSMAGSTGALGKLIVPGYYIPTQMAHSTVSSILSRLEERPDIDGVGFAHGPQREKASMALGIAHSLILNVLELQKEHFKLQALEQSLQACFQDFMGIWGTTEGA